MKEFLWITAQSFARRLKDRRGGILFAYLAAAFGLLVVMGALGALLWLEIESWKD